jgi:hypothetical protein
MWRISMLSNGWTRDAHWISAQSCSEWLLVVKLLSLIIRCHSIWPKRGKHAASLRLLLKSWALHLCCRRNLRHCRQVQFHDWGFVKFCIIIGVLIALQAVDVACAFEFEAVAIFKIVFRQYNGLLCSRMEDGVLSERTFLELPAWASLCACMCLVCLWKLGARECSSEFLSVK